MRQQDTVSFPSSACMIRTPFLIPGSVTNCVRDLCCPYPPPPSPLSPQHRSASEPSYHTQVQSKVTHGSTLWVLRTRGRGKRTSRPSAQADRLKKQALGFVRGTFALKSRTQLPLEAVSLKLPRRRLPRFIPVLFSDVQDNPGYLSLPSDRYWGCPKKLSRRGRKRVLAVLSFARRLQLL